MRGPLQILKELWTKNAPEVVKTTVQYIIDLRERLESTCTEAQKNLVKNAQRYAAAYNQQTKWRGFPVGSRVLLLLPTKSNTLEMAWRGPHEVKEKVNDMNYKIQVGDKLRLYHVNLLKAYMEREADCSETDKDSSELHSSAVGVIMEEEEDELEPALRAETPLPSLTSEEDPSGVKSGKD